MNAAPNDLASQLEILPRIKSFPAVATQLISACEDDNTNVRDLVGIIRCDPNLSVQLLRVSNSSMYGFGGKIKSIDHAAVVLGFRAVKNLALSVAAASVFAEGESSASARQMLWQHSLACATVAKMLTDFVPDVDAEEAFVAGIVHDVGKLVFFDLAEDSYAYSTGAIESTPTVADELRDFGVHHGQIGNRCSQQWGLPGDIGQAIMFHHAPQAADFEHSIVDIVYAANRLSKAWGIGAERLDDDVDSLDVIPDCALPLDEEKLKAIKGAAPAEFESLTTAFAI